MDLVSKRLRATIVLAFVLAGPIGLGFQAPSADALGQPVAGFWEGSEGWRILDQSWNPIPGLAVSPTSVLHVNVTSSLVDWQRNAGGGGALRVTLETFSGAVVRPFPFSQVTTVAPFRYTATVDLAPIGPALQPGWYYLRVFIDDIVTTWSSVEPILVGAAPDVGSIRTFTDDTFTQESDVFSLTSLVWVRIIGGPGGNADTWDLVHFLGGVSAVGGPRGGFDNFRRSGNVYTFSIDLGAFALTNGWFYTLEVRLRAGAFAEGKVIQVFDPRVSVAWADLVPATASQGQVDVPMIGLTLALDANWAAIHGPGAVNLERIRVGRIGPGASADIAGIRVYRDANGNGGIDPADVLVGSTYNLGGIPFPAWVGTAGTTMAYLTSDGPLRLIVAFNVSPTAAVGNRDGAFIAAGDVRFGGRIAGLTGLPATSGTFQVTGATVTTVTNDPGIAPPTASQGQQGVPIDLLTLRTNGPAVDLVRLDVTFVGTARTDVTLVALHTDNGDGVFDPSVDARVASGPFPAAGPARLNPAGVRLTAVPRDLWITYDIAPSATLGDLVGSEVSAAASVGVSAGSVFDQGFPLTSGSATVSGPMLTVSRVNLAPGIVRRGRVNAPMLELDLTLSSGTSTVSGVRIDKVGTSALDSDVPSVKLWRDTGNGVFDPSDTLIATGAFVTGVATMGPFSVAVTAPNPVVLFVTYDIGAAAPLGATVGARLADPTYVVASGGTTIAGPFPLRSTDSTIVAGGPGSIVTVTGTDLVGGVATVAQGQADVPFEKLVLSVDLNYAVVQGLSVDKTGTSTVDADVGAVKLYRDSDANGRFGGTDALLGSSIFIARRSVFSGLNLNVSASQPQILFLVLDMSASAALGFTVGVALENGNYVSLAPPSTVDAAHFPLRSSTPAIATATNGTLSGTVTDASGAPIAGATVVIVELGISTTTDAGGRYRIPGVPFGTYNVTASGAGYRSTTQTVRVSGPSATADFALQGVFGSVPFGVGVVLIGLLAVLAILGVVFALWKRRRKKEPEAIPEPPPPAP